MRSLQSPSRRSTDAAPPSAHVTEAPGSLHSVPAFLIAGLSLSRWVAAGDGRQPPIEVQNVRIGFGGTNAFKIGAWTPVRVQLKAGGERVSGFWRSWCPTTTASPPPIASRSTSLRNESQRLHGLRPSRRSRHGVHDPGLRSPERPAVLEAPQAITLPTAPEVIMPDEMLILTLGQPLGVDQVPNLPASRPAGKAETAGRRRWSWPGWMPRTTRFPGDGTASMPPTRSCSIPSDRAALQALDGLQRPGARGLGPARRAPRGLRGRQLASGSRQRPGPDPAGPAGRPGAGALARGDRHLRRLDQADHAGGHAAGHGDQARGSRRAGRQASERHRRTCRSSSAGRTGSAGSR